MVYVPYLLAAAVVAFIGGWVASRSAAERYDLVERAWHLRRIALLQDEVFSLEEQERQLRKQFAEERLISDGYRRHLMEFAGETVSREVARKYGEELAAIREAEGIVRGLGGRGHG